MDRRGLRVHAERSCDELGVQSVHSPGRREFLAPERSRRHLEEPGVTAGINEDRQGGYGQVAAETLVREQAPAPDGWTTPASGRPSSDRDAGDRAAAAWDVISDSR